jgi:transposase
VSGLFGIEACASSHHWSRQLKGLGHAVRLMPPAYVKPYVKRQKNDATDAEAICESVRRSTMRFVEIKTLEQQNSLMLHRTRHLIIRQTRHTGGARGCSETKDFRGASFWALNPHELSSVEPLTSNGGTR